MVICPILAVDKRNVSAESRLTEALGLTVAINLNVVYSQIVNLKEVKPATYFSKGFLEKVLPIVEEKEIKIESYIWGFWKRVYSGAFNRGRFG